MLWKLPCRSQLFRQGPHATVYRRTVIIKYDCLNSNDEYRWASITFTGVHGFSFTRDYSCTPDQIKAYDKIVEITSSAWAEELTARWPKAIPIKPLKHYRIYFDSVGCYEIAAENFDAPN
jgi:hypothetical protein